MPPKRKSTAKQAEEEEELKRQAELEEARQQGIQTAKSRNQPDIDSLDFPTKVKQNIQEALNSCETLEDETISVESLPAILQKLGIQVQTGAKEQQGIDVYKEHSLLETLRDTPDSRITTAEVYDIFKTISRPNRYYGQLLRQAAGRGELDKVRDYIYRGCDPCGVDGNGWTAVHYAAEFGRTETIAEMQRLRGAGILDIDAPDNIGWTPLMIAANTGKSDTVSWLLRAGADPNEQNDHLRSALHCASAEGFVGCIETLLKFDADINLKDSSGFTPLHLAGLHGQENAVSVLLEHDAETESPDVLHHSPGHWAHDTVRAKFPNLVYQESAESKK